MVYEKLGISMYENINQKSLLQILPGLHYAWLYN